MGPPDRTQERPATPPHPTTSERGPRLWLLVPRLGVPSAGPHQRPDAGLFLREAPMEGCGGGSSWRRRREQTPRRLRAGAAWMRPERPISPARAPPAPWSVLSVRPRVTPGGQCGAGVASRCRLPCWLCGQRPCASAACLLLTCSKPGPPAPARTPEHPPPCICMSCQGKEALQRSCQHR